MAKHYVSTTKTYTVKDTYSSYWLQADLSVTIDASGNGSWTLTMTNDTGGKCMGSLVFYIGTTKIHELYYDASYTPSSKSGNPKWDTGFPIKHNTKASGTFTTSSGSVKIGLAVCRSQAAVTYDTDTNRKRLTDGTAARIGAEKPSDSSADHWAFYTTLSRSYWNDIAAPKASVISDGYANSFSITGYTSSGATGNSVNSTTLYYKVGSGSYTAVPNNALTYSGSFTPSGTGNTMNIYAYTTVDGAKNDPSSSTTTTAVRQYKAPNTPTNLTIDSSSYKNGRLTIKKDWKFTWTASTPGTGTGTTNGTESNKTTSKVKGYKINIQKKTGSGSFTTIAIKNSSGTAITDSSHNYYANVTSLTFSPLKSGILPGDQVKIIVKPYTQYGLNNTGSYLYGTEATYTTRIVQNAGVMRVKPSAAIGWKEGVVWVKMKKNGVATWIEADIVKTKVGTVWRESQ